MIKEFSVSSVEPILADPPYIGDLKAFNELYGNAIRNGRIAVSGRKNYIIPIPNAEVAVTSAYPPMNSLFRNQESEPRIEVRKDIISGDRKKLLEYLYEISSDNLALNLIWRIEEKFKDPYQREKLIQGLANACRGKDNNVLNRFADHGELGGHAVKAIRIKRTEPERIEYGYFSDWTSELRVLNVVKNEVVRNRTNFRESGKLDALKPAIVLVLKASGVIPFEEKEFADFVMKAKEF